MEGIELTCHIYAVKAAWDTPRRYEVASFGSEHAPSTWLHVCEHKIVVEMPATFNPVAAEIEAIEREIEKVQAESSAHIRRLNDRKANLTCIEYTPAQEVA